MIAARPRYDIFQAINYWERARRLEKEGQIGGQNYEICMRDSLRTPDQQVATFMYIFFFGRIALSGCYKILDVTNREYARPPSPGPNCSPPVLWHTTPSNTNRACVSNKAMKSVLLMLFFRASASINANHYR